MFGNSLSVTASVCWYLFGLTCMIEATPTSVEFVSKIEVSAEDSSFFGESLSVSQNYLLVGSPNCSPSDNYRAGCAFVFEYNEASEDSDEENWNQVQEIIASDLSADSRFGSSVSISNDERNMIIGAWNANKAYVYYRDDPSSLWQQDEILFPTNDVNYDYFGYSVDILGSYAIVGDSGNDDFGTNSGSVHVFQRDESNGTWTWNEVQMLYGDDPESGVSFGYSVSISSSSASGADSAHSADSAGSAGTSGARILVGAFRKATFGSFAGCAYIFDLNEDTGLFEQSAQLYASDAGEGDAFGIGVSLSENYAVIGARGQQNSRGAAYIFEKNEAEEQTVWTEISKITPLTEDSYQYYGNSVSIFDDIIVVGSFGTSDSQGDAYVYQRDDASGSWTLLEHVSASDGMAQDKFGLVVAMSEQWFVIGAPGDESQAGSAYIYQIDEPQSPYAESVSANDNFIGVVTTDASSITWHEARSYCMTQYGTDLAVITSSEENDEAKLAVQQAFDKANNGWTGSYDAWIGLHDQENEGTMEWVNGHLASDGYTNWAPGEPNNRWSGDGEDCSCMYGLNGYWNDLICDPSARATQSQIAFICGHPVEENQLCHTEKWNDIKGIWTYNENDCSLMNGNNDAGNVVWFGNVEGDTPDAEFSSYDAFTLEVKMSLQSGPGFSRNGGILFRARSVSTTNDGGEQYYFGMDANTDHVTFGKMEDSWNYIKAVSFELEFDTIYTIKVVASGSPYYTYDIYVDDTLVIDSQIVGSVSDYIDGSIGLRTFHAPATYYSVRYINA